MGSLAQAISLIDASIKEINEQIGSINEFKRKNAGNIALVTAELSGSQHGHDATMLASLRRAEETLSSTVSALRRAAEAATRARNI